MSVRRIFMKKFFSILFLMIALINLSACNNSALPNDIIETSSIQSISSEQSDTSSVQSEITSSEQSDTFSTQSEISDNPGDEITEKKCTLIVKGKDITNEAYVHINDEKISELPITAIMRELGATVQWKDKEVIITYENNTTILDTEKSHFGIMLPPGSKGAIRKIINGEIILDASSAKQIIYPTGSKISVDYDNNIITIE